MTDQEINEAVARRLGWEPPTKEHCLSWIGPKESDGCEPPNYCHDIKAALEIIEFLISKKWEINIAHGLSPRRLVWAENPNDFEVTFESDHEDAPVWRKASSLKISKAICLAFLRIPEAWL